MNHIQIVLAAALWAMLTMPVHGQTYTVGSVVDNYTLTDFNTGEQVSLYELGQDGGVLVLEWFAWWCPFCADAAVNVKSGIVNHYGGRNLHDVPVKHIAINVQGNAEMQSQSFAETYGFRTVLEDYQRLFFSLFSPGGGQPLFVIINAEPNSPSYERWEVLYTRLNYGGGASPDISALMRPVIDSVKKGSPDPAAQFLAYFPNAGEPVDGWYELPDLGWLEPSQFPWVYSWIHGYLFLAGAGGDFYIIYDPKLGWLATGPGLYPYFFSYDTQDWLYYQPGSTMPRWFFDYSVDDWKSVD